MSVPSDKPTKTVRIGAIQSAYQREIRPECSTLEALDLIEENVTHVCNLVKHASDQGVQIVCTPEDVMGLVNYCLQCPNKKDVSELISQAAQRTYRIFQDVCRKSDIYVVGCWYEAVSPKIYNVAHLMDNKGEIVGRYCKTHMPPGEAEVFSSGEDYPVFDTEFGRLGMLICWDMMFPEPARLLCLQKADIIFNPTLGVDFGGEAIGQMRLRIRAFDNAVNIACAMPGPAGGDGPGLSCIINTQGDVLADAGYEPDKVIFADLDLAALPPDLADPERKYGLDMRSRWIRGRRPDTYGRLVEQV